MYFLEGEAKGKSKNTLLIAYDSIKITYILFNSTVFFDYVHADGCWLDNISGAICKGFICTLKAAAIAFWFIIGWFRHPCGGRLRLEQGSGELHVVVGFRHRLLGPWVHQVWSLARLYSVSFFNQESSVFKKHNQVLHQLCPGTSATHLTLCPCISIIPQVMH